MAKKDKELFCGINLENDTFGVSETRQGLAEELNISTFTIRNWLSRGGGYYTNGNVTVFKSPLIKSKHKGNIYNFIKGRDY